MDTELHWEVGVQQWHDPEEEYYVAFVKEFPQICSWSETEELAVSALEYAKNVYFEKVWGEKAVKH